MKSGCSHDPSTRFDAIDKFCGFQYSIVPDTYGLTASDNEAASWAAGDLFYYRQDNGGYCSHYLAKGYHGIDTDLPWPNDKNKCPDPDSGDMEIDILIKWSDIQQGCSPKRNFRLFNLDTCRSTLRRLIDDCDTNTTAEKWGGAWRINSDAGCFDIAIGGVREDKFENAQKFPVGEPGPSHELKVDVRDEGGLCGHDTCS